MPPSMREFLLNSGPSLFNSSQCRVLHIALIQLLAQLKYICCFRKQEEMRRENYHHNKYKGNIVFTNGFKLFIDINTTESYLLEEYVKRFSFLSVGLNV